MYIAHYESRYGQLPLDVTLALTQSNEPNDEQLKLLTSGLKTLVGVLGTVVQGFDVKTEN